jgi:hypothetical protein
MRRKFNDNKIKNNTNLNEAARFFIQRVLEILDPKTIPAYSVKYLNSHIALQELLEVCDKTIEGLYREDHLKAVLDEVRTIILKDTLLEKYDAPYKKLIIKTLDISVKNKELRYNRLKYDIKHALHHLDKHYIDWIIMEISYRIDENRYEKLDYICFYSHFFFMFLLLNIHKLI